MFPKSVKYPSAGLIILGSPKSKIEKELEAVLSEKSSSGTPWSSFIVAINVIKPDSAGTQVKYVVSLSPKFGRATESISVVSDIIRSYNLEILYH